MNNNKRAEEYRCAQTRLAMLAHDINNPLTTVLSSLSLIDNMLKNTDNEVLEKNCKRILDISMHEIYRITRLTNNTIYADKMYRGLFEMDMCFQDLAEEIDTIAQEITSFAQQKDVSFEYVCSECPVLLVCNTEMLSRAVYSLLSNAFKAVPPKDGKVTMTLSGDRENVYISVSNNGNKIPAEDIDLLFDMYWHTDNSKNASIINAGLGLYIVKNVAVGHGGDVKAESNDEATEFTIILPKKDITGLSKLQTLRSSSVKYKSSDAKMMLLTEMNDLI